MGAAHGPSLDSFPGATCVYGTTINTDRGDTLSTPDFSDMTHLLLREIYEQCHGKDVGGGIPGRHNMVCGSYGSSSTTPSSWT